MTRSMAAGTNDPAAARCAKLEPPKCRYAGSPTTTIPMWNRAIAELAAPAASSHLLPLGGRIIVIGAPHQEVLFHSASGFVTPSKVSIAPAEAAPAPIVMF